jgi:hypothetical protein
MCGACVEAVGDGGDDDPEEDVVEFEEWEWEEKEGNEEENFIPNVCIAACT